MNQLMQPVEFNMHQHENLMCAEFVEFSCTYTQVVLKLYVSVMSVDILLGMIGLMDIK